MNTDTILLLLLVSIAVVLAGTVRKCGIDLDQWLEGFKDTPTSV